MRKFSFFFSLVLMFPPSGVAWATQYYFAAAGDDARSCTAAQNPGTPKQTEASGVTCFTSNADVLKDLDTNSLVVPANAPMFVDAANGDFHLVPNSAAINAGADLSAEIPAVDFDGITRPQGSAWDIGAYEFVQGTPLIAPSAPSNLTTTSP